MIIDKKGRLFGKVSIIDIFIVVVLVVGAYFVFKRFAVMDMVVVQGEDYIVTFYSEDTPDFVADKVQIGDRVEDEAKTLDLGKVIAIENSPGFYYVTDSQGNIKKTEREGITSMKITAELKAQPYEHGFILSGGNKYGVGHGLTIRAGKAKIWLKISGIERKS